MRSVSDQALGDNRVDNLDKTGDIGTQRIVPGFAVFGRGFGAGVVDKESGIEVIMLTGIEGTRHRTGTWSGEPVTSAHPVAFTVFVVCAPTYDTCYLLRLSQLDNPLR